MEPYRVVVLVPQTHGDVRALPRRGRVWSREIRGDSGALPNQVVGPVPQARGDAKALQHWERVWSRGGTRRHRSPPLPGAESGVTRLNLNLVCTGVLGL
jgi:hypothetical protein